MRIFHVYKDVWSTLTGEETLECFHEKENKTYEFSIAVYRKDLSRKIIVGHKTTNISKVLVMFLQLPNSFFTCNDNGK